MTQTIEPQPLRRTFMLPAIGALLLAMGFSFLAGRATVAPAHAREPQARPAAAPPEAAPPWCTHGFRDDESAGDVCVTPPCNG